MTTPSGLLGGGTKEKMLMGQGYNYIKEAMRFDSKRDDWCRLENFEDMHNSVYEKIADASIAEVLHDEV
jgi:Fe-S-cluster formation regulator IscX/YfhJ